MISPSDSTPSGHYTVYSSAGLEHRVQGGRVAFFTVLLAGLYFSITLGVLACIKIFMDEMVGTHSGPNSSLNTRAISGQLELSSQGPVTEYNFYLFP